MMLFAQLITLQAVGDCANEAIAMQSIYVTDHIGITDRQYCKKLPFFKNQPQPIKKKLALHNTGGREAFTLSGYFVSMAHSMCALLPNDTIPKHNHNAFRPTAKKLPTYKNKQ